MTVRARRLLVAGLVAAGLLTASAPVRARTVVADLSHHLVAIDTAFSGADVVLFGTIDEPGDVAVVARGPVRALRVRRKDRVAGIWINTEQVPFADAPVYYALATSRPLTEIAPLQVRARIGLGLDVLSLGGARPQEMPDDVFASFRQGLIRNQQAAGLYPDAVGQVVFLGQRLFRTTLSFPANVPPGDYLVEAFHLRDGQVLGAQSSVLDIGKVGFEATLFDFSRHRAAAYGGVALLIAVVSGWLAGVIFRND